MAKKSDQNLSSYIIHISTTSLRTELSYENKNPVTVNKAMSDMLVVSLHLLSFQSQVLGVRTGISSCLTLLKENSFSNVTRRSQSPHKCHL